MSAAAVNNRTDAADGTVRACGLLVVNLDATGSHRKTHITPEQVARLELVRAAGHYVLLQTRMPLIGLLPLARRLGATDGAFAVASGGAVTARLDTGMPGGYDVQEAATFDPAPLIRQIQALTAGALLAVEQIGGRWRVNRTWPGELGLVGRQQQVTNDMLSGLATPQVVVHAPALARDVDALGSLTRLTVASMGGGTYVVTTSTGASPEVAVQTVRSDLGGPPVWTTSLDNLLVQTRSLVPPPARRTGLSPLAAQLTAALATAEEQAAVRVWHRFGSADLAGAEIWTRPDKVADGWRRHAPLPAARAATMRDIEHAAIDAGLIFPRSKVGRRRAQWRSNVTPGQHDERAGMPEQEPGFALPLTPLQDEPTQQTLAGHDGASDPTAHTTMTPETSTR